jgi:hypothetical protein
VRAPGQQLAGSYMALCGVHHAGPSGGRVQNWRQQLTQAAQACTALDSSAGCSSAARFGPVLLQNSAHHLVTLRYTGYTGHTVYAGYSCVPCRALFARHVAGADTHLRSALQLRGQQVGRTLQHCVVRFVSAQVVAGGHAGLRPDAAKMRIRLSPCEFVRAS